MKIGNWNVRTMYSEGKSTQVAKAMKDMKIQITRISTCRWTGAGTVQLSTGETVLYSGRDDYRHMQGVAMMMSQEATKALIDWTTIDERIIKARFYTTLVLAYAPTHEADEQTKEDFSEKRQEAADVTNVKQDSFE